MNLFLESPQQEAERLLREQRRQPYGASTPSGPGAVASAPPSPWEGAAPYASSAQPAPQPAPQPMPQSAPYSAQPAAYPGQPQADWERYSLEQETYRDEMAFNRKRASARKRRGILRALAFIVAVPLMLIVAFVVSYVLTCILNGASPDDIALLLGDLWARVQGWLHL